MLNIAICDDDQSICTDLEDKVYTILDGLNVKYEIDVYFSGYKLHEKMSAGIYYDLIFLDISFAENEIDGIEVGKLIREAHNNHTVSIVYISWETKYSMQLFEIHPLNFLIKPLEYDKIEQTIRTYLKISGFLSEEFIYKIGHSIYKEQLKNIMYLESRDRKLILHLTDGRKEEFYGSLRDAYNEQLKRFDFLFIHASYIVNYDHIAVKKYDSIYMSNCRTPLPISQNRRNDVRERYFAIMKRRSV